MLYILQATSHRPAERFYREESARTWVVEQRFVTSLRAQLVNLQSVYLPVHGFSGSCLACQTGLCEKFSFAHNLSIPVRFAELGNKEKCRPKECGQTTANR